MTVPVLTGVAGGAGRHRGFGSDHPGRIGTFALAEPAFGDSCTAPPYRRGMARRGVVLVAALLVVSVGLVVLVMVSRVDEPGRFVTWPVVGLTTLAAVVAALGVLRGQRRPLFFAVSFLPAFVFSYFLAGSPVLVVTVVLVGLGAVATRADVRAGGFVAWTGLFVVTLTLMQEPVVQCRANGVATSSGPWWVHSSHSSGSGSSGPGANSRGTLSVGGRDYEYQCVDGHLAHFHRAR